ncbi:ATP-binding protein [Rhodovarius lipocyclicus]|uniref:ATP-binding protein n=1 Tax=Rhodovarius lipocyclicus TaxID=268410 RepID=UPI001356EAFB|nr:ATP-binding protein [Rhodovarius lipocyclicus]
MRLWRLFDPRSLAGRTVWLLVGGLTLLHVGSMLIHERTLHGAELNAFEAQVTDRILAAAGTALMETEDTRPQAVAALSLPGIALSWQRERPEWPAAPAGDAARELQRRLGPRAEVAGRDDSTLSGRLRVGDQGWVRFTVEDPPAHGLPENVGDWLLVAAMAFGILLASIPVVGWMTEPLRRLSEAANRLGRDPRPAILSTSGPVEVRQAAQAFNAMQARIVRLIEDRTEALAALSHDLRTPLARLRLRVSFLPEGEERTRIEAEVREMEGMVSGTLAYFREGRDAEPAVRADLAAILQTLADEAADLGHDVRYEGPDHLVLPLRRVAAKRAFQNLLNNALAHGAPPVSLALRVAGREVVVEVRDHGPGIPQAQRVQALQPFVRLDPARGGGGLGLGLATAQRFALAEGGRLELDEAQGGGLIARVTLPYGSMAG